MAGRDSEGRGAARDESVRTDVIVAVFLVALTWSVFLGVTAFSYDLGRHGEPSGWAMLYLVVLAVPAAITVVWGPIALLLRCVGAWRVRSRVRWARTAIVIAVPALILGPSFLPDRASPFCKGLRDRILATPGGVAELKAWQSTLHGNPGDEVPPDQWPRVLKDLRPHVVVLHEGSPTAYCVCGSGFGHWGLSVGPDAATLPVHFKVICRLKLDDDVYVWEE